MTRKQLVRLECLYRNAVGPHAPGFALEPGDHPCVIAINAGDNLCERCMNRDTGMLIAQLMNVLPELIAAARVGGIAAELIKEAQRGAS
jgi:hypothetical protein